MRPLRKQKNKHAKKTTGGHITNQPRWTKLGKEEIKSGDLQHRAGVKHSPNGRVVTENESSTEKKLPNASSGNHHTPRVRTRGTKHMKRRTSK